MHLLLSSDAQGYLLLNYFTMHAVCVTIRCHLWKLMPYIIHDYCILTNLTLVNEVLHPDNAKQHFLGLSKHINRTSLQNNKRNNTQIKRFKNTYN